ncbi:MAG: GNAT family N-acetyltransferase [Pseudomonadota bacterium]
MTSDQPTAAPHFFSTHRLTVRGFELSDFEDLARINASPTVSRYVDDGKPLSRDDVARWIETSQENLARFGYGTGAVIHRSNGTLIGWAGFARGPDPSDRSDEELIYGLDEPWWGQGLGTELVAGLVRYAKRLAIAPLRATVYRANHASIRVLERHGFVRAEADYRGDRGIDLYVVPEPAQRTPRP